MCRLLAYRGPTVQLDQLIYHHDHSLIVQSYQPREMETAILNADGVGIGWYHPTQKTAPFVYRNTLPAWNDINLPHLCRYAESGAVLAYVRSATPGLAVDLHNCQPFTDGPLCFIHNGYIEHFRHNLYRPIRESLPDDIYRTIHGLTDSEHIFAMVRQRIKQSRCPLNTALYEVLETLSRAAAAHGIRVAANIIISDGEHMVASRYDTTGQAPSLYWLQNHPRFPNSVLFASEPLFEAEWSRCPENTLVTVDANRDLHCQTLAFTPADQAA